MTKQRNSFNEIDGDQLHGAFLAGARCIIANQKLLNQYQSVIAIHFSENLTGTFATSQKAAQDVSRRTGKRIDVVNSASLTGGEGMLVLRVAQAIEEGR